MFRFTSQDIIAAIHETMTSVDNAITLNKLRSCPYSLDANQVIRCDLFSVYLTHGKKKPHLMLVCLHSNHVVFAHVKRDKTKDITVYEYRDSIEVSHIPIMQLFGHLSCFVHVQLSLYRWLVCTC